MRTELGLVPEYEEREVAIFTGYSWKEWTALPVPERAASVAHYRLRQLIGSHIHDVQQTEAAKPRPK